jgi:F-type H+-transporting ATPase subunit c
MAPAQEHPATARAGGAAAQPSGWSSGTGLGVLGLCVGAGLAVLGGAMAIGKVGSSAPEAIARQPEAAGDIFLAWLLPAAMIEGATLFGITVCLLAVIKVK